MQLKGAIAMVTGAARERSIGRACAELLLQEGASVCIVDVLQDEGLEAVKDFEKQFGTGRVIFCSCDVTDEQAVRATFQTCKDTFGRIDILINSAGSHGELPLQEVGLRILDINLKGTILMAKVAREFIGKLAGNSDGVVINVSSVLAFVPMAGYPVYVAGKAALVAYTRSMATKEHVATTGIRTNCICPGKTNTDITKGYTSDRYYYYEESQKLEKSWGGESMEPSFVAKVILDYVKDDEKNGEVSVVRATGVQIMEFPVVPVV